MKYWIDHLLQGIIVVAIAILLAGCSHGRFMVAGERVGVAVEKHDWGYHHSQRAYNIPPGHMPPPGSCRIWYPGTPPGHQPPPGDCYRLSQRVPPDAWLIRG